MMQSPCNREPDTSTDEQENSHLVSESVTFGEICETDGEYNGSVHVQVLLWLLVIFKSLVKALVNIQCLPYLHQD